MTSPAHTVAVVGAGIGGLTLAAALRRAGITVCVYEKASRLDTAGAGLQLAPNAVRLLRRLGLAEHLSRHGVEIEATELRSWDDDRLLSRTVLGSACQQRFGAPYYTIHRAHLHDALRFAARTATLHCGYTLDGIDAREDRAVLRFAHGGTVATGLAVGADGIRSVVRRTLAVDAPVYSGYAIWRGLVARRDAPPAATEPRVRVWLGAGQHFVSYPVDGGRSVSFAATVPAPDSTAESWSVGGSAPDVAAAYRGWNPTVTGLLRAAGTVRRWSLNDREPLERWSAGRVTLLGDAAHPMLPFLAQGANQAIEDAFTLAACLSAKPDRSDPVQALRHYEAVRIPRTTAIQRAARQRGAPRGPGHPRGGEVRDMSADALAWMYGYDAELAGRHGTDSATKGFATATKGGTHQ